jgi:hypothetical protein
MLRGIVHAVPRRHARPRDEDGEIDHHASIVVVVCVLVKGEDVVGLLVRSGLRVGPAISSRIRMANDREVMDDKRRGTTRESRVRRDSDGTRLGSVRAPQTARHGGGLLRCDP